MDTVKINKAKQILITIAWCLVASGTIGLLAASVIKTDRRKCTGIEVEISGANKNFFIDKDDILKIISTYSSVNPDNNPLTRFDLRSVEEVLRKEIWVKNAELFFDNNGILQVVVDEREPIARIYTTSGSSFYIDSSLMILPLSDKLSARVPVFTGFPTEAKILSSADARLLKDIRNLTQVIADDTFLMAMIDQVEITGGRKFEMYPKIGDQVILFGDASDFEEKFSKLGLFYKNIMSNTSWNRYSEINLQYKNQVVGKIKSAADVAADSLRTIQLMKMIAEYTEKMAADTNLNTGYQKDIEPDISMVVQSVQRDEPDVSPILGIDDIIQEEKLVVIENKTPVKPEVKTADKKSILKPAKIAEKPRVIKPAIRESGKIIKQAPKEKPKNTRTPDNQVQIPKPVKKEPKAVMKSPVRETPENDY